MRSNAVGFEAAPFLLSVQHPTAVCMSIVASGPKLNNPSTFPPTRLVVFYPVTRTATFLRSICATGNRHLLSLPSLAWDFLFFSTQHGGLQNIYLPPPIQPQRVLSQHGYFSIRGRNSSDMAHIPLCSALPHGG